MHGGRRGGCKIQGAHPHEYWCLRRLQQYRLLFIPSTLSCVLGPASRHDTSNSTLFQSYYQPIYFFHLLRSRLKNPYMLLLQKKPYFVRYWDALSCFFKVAVNTIVPRSPFFLFLYLKTQTVTHIRKKAVEYLLQWNGAICVIYNLCQRQNIS